MKKIILICFILFSFNLLAQKEKNGTVYKEHPGIALVESFHKAIVDGDFEKAASILDDDFRIKNGVGLNKDAKGFTKQRFMNNMIWWNENFDYLSIKRDEPAYPDAIEYKQGDQIWVQTWERIYGVNKNTGLKVDMPFHRLYYLNNESTKIKFAFEYANQNVFNSLNDNNYTRENGTIFINHENINVVRKVMYAFENADYDKAYSYFSENSTFYDMNDPWGTNFSLEEAKKRNEGILDQFEILGFDEIGYPDYLEYGKNNSKVVLSWWKFRMKRKSDNKLILLPIHYSHTFNNEGKIIRSTAYYSSKHME